MNPIGYIQMLYGFKRDIDLSDQSMVVFRRFIKNEYTSTYQLWKFLNSIGHKIAYKNVRKQVQRLLLLELLKIAKRSKKHQAIYYKLSSSGLFYIFYKRLIPFHLPTLVRNHENDPIFEIFLYPLFKKETLLALNTTVVDIEIEKYLADCCKKIDQTLVNAKKAESDKYIEAVFPYTWNDIPNPDSEINDMFISFIRSESNSQLPEGSFEMKKIANDTIKISWKATHLYILLDRIHRKVIFKKSKRIMGQVQAKPIGYNQNEFYMYTVMPTSAERHLKSEKFNVMEYSPNDVEKLFITLTQCYQDNGSEENEKANDFQILKDDKRFLQILSTMNRRYRNNYDYFLDKLGEFL